MNYRGLIATIFAASLGGSFMLAIAAMSYWGKSFSEKGADVLIAIGGAMSAVVGVYIGANIPKP